ncbi:MAG TPA: hypothetical protein VLG28_10385 [Acidimicrobiia bacterium]|nr:hypothetical protein [Acidimicrobiia bacterium]
METGSATEDVIVAVPVVVGRQVCEGEFVGDERTRKPVSIDSVTSLVDEE